MMEKLLDKCIIYIISGQIEFDEGYDLKKVLRSRLHNKVGVSYKVNLIINKIKNCLTVKYDETVATQLRNIISIWDVENLDCRILAAQRMVKRQLWYEEFIKSRSKFGDPDSAFYSESGKTQNKLWVSKAKKYAESGKTQNKLWVSEISRHLETESFVEGLVRGLGLKACRDKTIIAVIEDKGKFFIGTNGMMYDTGICPRNEANHKINQGYHLCKHVCIQPEHAEIAAINKWKLEAVSKNPILHVFGAKRICDDCRNYAKQNGVNRIAVYKDTVNLKTLLSKEY